MIIEKAIEILTDPDPDIDGIMNEDYKDASNLGIEALKAVKDARANNYYTPIPLLPGETED